MTSAAMLSASPRLLVIELCSYGHAHFTERDYVTASSVYYIPLGWALGLK